MTPCSSPWFPCSSSFPSVHVVLNINCWLLWSPGYSFPRWPNLLGNLFSKGLCFLPCPCLCNFWEVSFLWKLCGLTQSVWTPCDWGWSDLHSNSVVFYKNKLCILNMQLVKLHFDISNLMFQHWGIFVLFEKFYPNMILKNLLINFLICMGQLFVPHYSTNLVSLIII